MRGCILFLTWLLISMPLHKVKNSDRHRHMTPGGWYDLYFLLPETNLTWGHDLQLSLSLSNLKLAFLFMILFYCANLGLLIFLLVLGLSIILYYIVIIFIWQLSIWPCLGCHWPKVKVKQMSEWLSGAVPVNKCVLTWLSLANGEVQVKVNAFLWLNLTIHLIFIVAQPESP